MFCFGTGLHCVALDVLELCRSAILCLLSVEMKGMCHGARPGVGALLPGHPVNAGQALLLPCPTSTQLIVM